MKRILFSIAISIASIILFSSSVSAYVITPEDIVEYFNEHVKEDGDGIKVAAKGSVVEYYVDDELVDSYDMATGYMEYTSQFYNVSDLKKLIISTMRYLIYSIPGEEATPYFAISSDFVNYDNFSEEKKESLFERYGVYHKSLEGSNEYYTKLSFDIDKGDRQFLEIMTFVENLTPEVREALSNTPEISIENINKNSANIYPKNASDNNLFESKDNLCIIYRSDKKDGDYQRISAKPIICNGEYALSDTTLEQGKTYYYKARLKYTNVLSEPYELTAKDSEKESTSSKKEIPDNPKTGVTSHIAITLLIAIISIIAVALLKKKNKLFSQI